MRDLEDEARIRAYMEAKMKHIKMYNECMNLADGLDVAKFAELVRADEREAIAQSLDKQADLAPDEIDRQWAQEMAAAIRARSRT